MDTLNHLPVNFPWFELSIFAFSVSFVLYVFNNVVLSDDGERAVKFSIQEPKQCDPSWKGDYLENPSIKVASQQFVPCSGKKS